MNTRAAAAVWGPQYWFFLHMAANQYPDFPNDTMKRKYYDLILNFPMFIPNADMADRFSSMLDDFPVSPYLRNREALTRWVYFMHSRYNTMLGKDSPVSYEAAQAEFLLRFDRDTIIASDLSDRETFVEAWSRRRRPAAVLMLLLAVAGAIIFFSRRVPRSSISE